MIQRAEKYLLEPFSVLIAGDPKAFQWFTDKYIGKGYFYGFVALKGLPIKASADGFL